MSKVAINFKTDKELKDAFYSVVKEMHTTPTSLFNMFMSHTVKNRSVNISIPQEPTQDLPQKKTKMTEQEFYEMIDRALEQEPIEMDFNELRAMIRG